MKRICSLLTLFVLNAFASAQVRTADSLKLLLQSEKRDTARVGLLDNLSYAYMNTHPDSAFMFSQQGLNLARKIKFEKGEAWCLKSTGTVYYNTGNYPKALEKDFEALEKFKKINDKRNTWGTLIDIGLIYWEHSDNEKALTYSLEALAIAKKLNDEVGMKYSLINIGNYYDELELLDSARIYTIKGYELAAKLKDTDWMSIALYNQGDIYSKIPGKGNLATEYFRRAYFGFKSVEDNNSLCQAMLGLAESFKRSNIPDSSIYYSKLALNTAQEGGFAKYILKASNFLANYYESLRNIDSAYRYQSLSIIAKDSLFSNEKINQIQNLSLDEAERRQKNEAAKLVLKNRIKLYGLLTLLFVFFVIVFLQYKNNLEKKKTNLVLQRQKEEIQNTLLQLKATQSQLIQSEKMASLGELTAGIAHEIQNPLNFVNNFSEVNEELIGELKNELAMGNMRSANEIANTIKSNEQKINQHGKRADSIVKGMLQHSRASSGQREPTDINALADEYLKLTYHGLRAKDKSFNAKFETQFDPTLGKINVVPQDIGRVLLNLINNAFYAVTEKRRQLDGGYEPTVSIITRRINSSGDGGEKVEVTVKDNGNGIPHKVIDKIFQPFFTTKPAGSGTGLGLSLSYDIIKTHGGEISVQSTEGEGSEFVISLPC